METINDLDKENGITYIESIRGKKLLVYQGFTYHKVREGRSNQIYYHCRKSICHGKGLYKNNNFKVTCPHICYKSGHSSLKSHDFNLPNSQELVNYPLNQIAQSLLINDDINPGFIQTDNKDNILLIQGYRKIREGKHGQSIYKCTEKKCNGKGINKNSKFKIVYPHNCTMSELPLKSSSLKGSSTVPLSKKNKDPSRKITIHNQGNNIENPSIGSIPNDHPSSLNFHKSSSIPNVPSPEIVKWPIRLIAHQSSNFQHELLTSGEMQDISVMNKTSQSCSTPYVFSTSDMVNQHPIPNIFQSFGMPDELATTPESGSDSPSALDSSSNPDTLPTTSDHEFIPSQKGRRLLYFSGYLYAIECGRGNNTYYRCRLPHCWGRCTSKAGGPIVQTKGHTHPPDIEGYEALKTRNLLKQAIRDNPDQDMRLTYDIVLNARMNESPDIASIPSAVPPFKSLSRTMRRMYIKAKPQPDVAKPKKAPTAPPTSDYEFVSSQKNTKLLYVHGYLHIKESSKGTSAYYKCRLPRCKGRCTFKAGVIVETQGHSHEPDVERYESLKTRNLLKQAIRDNPDQSRRLTYNDVLNARKTESPAIANIPAALPSYKTLQRSLQRVYMKSKYPEGTPIPLKPTSDIPLASPTSAYEFIPSQKGTKLLYVNGYLHQKEAAKRTVTYYKCRLRRCRGRCSLKVGIVTETQGHNHVPDLEGYETLRTRNSLKQAIRDNPDQPGRLIYYDVLNARRNESPSIVNMPSAIPPYKTLTHCIRRLHNKTRRHPLTSIETAVEEVIDSQTSPTTEMFGAYGSRITLNGELLVLDHMANDFLLFRSPTDNE